MSLPSTSAAVTLASGGTLNVARGASYQVQVATAYTLAGRTTIGAYSTAVTVNTLPAQSTVPSNLLLTTRNFVVNFVNTSTNISGCTIQRGRSATAGGAVTWTTITPVVSPSGTTYAFTDTVTAAGFYRYRVLATSVAGSTTYVTSPAVSTP